MSQTTIDENRLKELFKSTVIEVLEERRDVFYDVVAEAMEDIGLIDAIKAGEKTKSASRDGSLKSLRGRRESLFQKELHKRFEEDKNRKEIYRYFP